MAFINYYEILGLEEGVFKGKNEDEIQQIIKDSYRQKSRQNHPDKGGTREIFQLVANARDIFQDRQQRIKYNDQYSLFREFGAEVYDAYDDLLSLISSLGNDLMGYSLRDKLLENADDFRNKFVTYVSDSKYEQKVKDLANKNFFDIIQGKTELFDIRQKKFEDPRDKRSFLYDKLGDAFLYSEKIQKIQEKEKVGFSVDDLINKLFNDKSFRGPFIEYMKGENDQKVLLYIKDGLDVFINNVNTINKPHLKSEFKFYEEENESESSDDDISQPDENESDIFDISDDSDELELSESNVESLPQAKSVPEDKMQEQEELSNPFAKIPNGDKVLKAYHRVLDIITDIDLKRIYKQEKSYQKATNQVNLVELTNILCADSNFAQRFITYFGKNNDEEIRRVIKGGKEKFFSTISGQKYKQPKLFRQPTKLEVPHDFNDWNEEKEQKDPIIRSLRIIKTSRDLGVTRANRVSSRELVFAIADDLDFRNRFFMKFQNSSGEELSSALWCSFEVFNKRLKQDDSLNSTMGKELEEIEQSPIVRTLKSFNNLARINSQQAGEDLWNVLSKIVENEEFEKKFITIANSIDDEELEKLFMCPFKHVEKFVNDDSIYVSIQIQKEIMRIYQENNNDDKYEANLHEEYKEKALEIVQRSKEDETRSNLIRGLLDKKDRDARKDFLDKFIDDIICEQHSPTSSASSPFAESKAPSLDESKSSAK